MKRLLPLLALRDSLVGVVLLGLCAAAWRLTAGFDDVPPMLAQNVPPTFFPRLVIVTAALFCVVLILDEIRRSLRGAADPVVAPRAASTADSEPAAFTLLPPAFWGTVGVIAAAGVSIPLLGTLPSLGMIAVALPLVWGERRFRLVAGLAVGLPTSIHVVFALGLGVRFPVGSVWNLLLPG